MGEYVISVLMVVLQELTEHEAFFQLRRGLRIMLQHILM